MIPQSLRRLLVVTASLSLSLSPWLSMQALAAEQASSTSSDTSDQDLVHEFQPIVKIITYTTSGAGRLSRYEQGSGVVITTDGTVLTNRHVVTLEQTYDGKEREVAIQVCFLANSIQEAPDCTATAQLIASDADLDLALLKINPIPGMTTPQPYSPLLFATSTPSLNDTVYAAGYPGIGGGTFTVSKGVLTGKRKDGNKPWLQVDTASSFGSSGGPLVNSTGDIIGLTSDLSVDTGNSLTEALSTSVISPWVAAHQNDVPKDSKLTSRLLAFTQRQHEVKSGSQNVYSGIDPHIQITKPADWKFFLADDLSLNTYNENDPDGGEINIQSDALTGTQSKTNVLPYLRYSWMTEGSLQSMEVLEQKPIPFGAITGYRFKIGKLGKVNQFYAAITGSYYIQIQYSYGKNNKDQKIVDAAIASLQLSPDPLIKGTLTSWQNTNPAFHLTIPGAYVARPWNSPDQPLLLYYTKSPDAFVTVSSAKIDPAEQNLTNEARLKLTTQSFQQLKQSLLTLNAEIKLTHTVARARINPKVKDALLVESQLIKKDENKVIVQEKTYSFFRGDRKITLDLNLLSADRTAYKKAVADFEKLVSSISF